MIQLFLLCSWSCIVIYVWMIKSKYYWTTPPYMLSAFFALAGLFATLPAYLGNTFLSGETEFWVYSPERVQRFMGFFIGAGLGEEFWKMGFGTCLVLLLLSLKIKMKESDVVLGFVTLGLSFASAENLIAYSHMNIQLLISRGFLAVPVHAGMGMIHGLAVHKAMLKGGAGPLFSGYFCAVVLHTLWDTWGIIFPRTSTYFGFIFLVSILIIWCVWRWRKVPEIDDPLPCELKIKTS